MLTSVLVVFCIGNVLLLTQGASKSRCAVVVFVNQSSFKTGENFTEYLGNIQGLAVNKTNVYFSDKPETFKVKHGTFIDAPGLFALESEKFPGMFLRRADHNIVLQQESETDTFKNDATFLMDQAENNESYTTLRLFSHRSWKLYSYPDSKGPLFFDIPKNGTPLRKGIDLMVIAQPCQNKETNQSKESGSKDMSSGTTTAPDPTLNRETDTKFVTAVTNRGLNPIFNEYSFENFEVPDFIMHSLLEDDKNAGDGMEAPKPDIQPSASIAPDNPQKQQQTVEHQTKLPTSKQKISELSSLIDENDVNDIEDTLKDLQYGSKGCKLLVAEDSTDEDATSKDTVAYPEKNRQCIDQFPNSCEEMAKKGYCLAFKSLMSTVCRRSCNLCSRLMDTGFTSCTKSCGGGRQMRMIKINRREYLQTRRCNSQPCPVDGGYSEFGKFTECSVTCGKGIMYRQRSCTKPRPQFNGRTCRRLGPSIESKDCDAGVCPNTTKHHKHDTDRKREKKLRKGSDHHKSDLHIDGPHSDKVHEHLVLLKGKKVAKLRCTPRSGQLRSIVQDTVTKRFTVHQSSKKPSLKKSDIEEGEVMYSHEGVPVDTSSTVVKAFKSPYKIILSRKGPHKMKLLEECLEADDSLDEVNDYGDDTSVSENYRNSEDGTDLLHDMLARKRKETNKYHRSKQVYRRPGEKSFEDFDEYKYEAGDVVTPQVAMSQDDNSHDYSTPSGKLFDGTKSLDFFLNKMDVAKAKIDDQLSDEQDLESSFKIENEKPVDAFTFNGHGSDQEVGDVDSGSQAGFAVTTLPDSGLVKSGDRNGNDDNRDDDGYRMESLADP